MKEHGWGLDNETDYPQIKNIKNALDGVPLTDVHVGKFFHQQ